MSSVHNVASHPVHIVPHATATSQSSTESSNEPQPYEDIVPATMLHATAANKHPMQHPLYVLMDSGSSATLIHRSCLPPGCVPERIEAKSTQTTAGTFEINQRVQLFNITLPEFSSSLTTKFLWAYVFDAPCHYGAIIGRDWLIPNKFDIKFATQTMEWFDRKVPMKDRTGTPIMTSHYVMDNIERDIDDEIHATQTIKEAKYEGISSLRNLADEQEHLTTEQKDILYESLKDFNATFEGRIGKYTKRKIHLELQPGAQPKHLRPFPVPIAHQATFKNEAGRLCEAGVLEKCGSSQHGYPTFIIPKKDGRVRWVSDFRELNKMLVRKQYGLPRIKDILHRRKAYRYFTKLDLSMFFYAFELDEESSWLCVIVTPHGKYRYKRLPMGIHNSPDFAQEIMEEIFNDMLDDGVEVFIDDIGIFSDNYPTHIETVTEVLRRLQENGFVVNPLKCQWAVQETDWLGYWFTPNGVKPWQKKIDGILRLGPPTNVSQLRSFIGAVNYYRDMWPRRAHLLAPLTSLTGKAPFVWTQEHQRSFEALKAMIVQDTILAYPDHNRPFHIYTDSSDYQLGSVIFQDDRPIAYYSRKLNPAQRNYTTMEKELLAITATCKEFTSLILGAEVHIHTDHKNLTYANLNTQRVLRWRMYLEQFNPTFHYIKGNDNVLADYLSRAPHEKGKDSDSISTPDDDEDSPMDSCFLTPGGCDVLDHFFTNECFLNAPPGPNPISYPILHQHQQNEQPLVNKLQTDPQQYQLRPFGNQQLICFQSRRPPNNLHWRIAVPSALVDRLIEWYHHVLIHPGSKRLFQSINFHFYHPELFRKCEDYTKHCQDCVRHKLPHQTYGHLAPREANYQPFYEIAVDSIGPWTIRINNENHQFRALTVTDTVTSLSEIARVNDASSAEAAHRLEQTWLFRYPRPVRCIFDAGTEFQGEFRETLQRWAIEPHPISIRNPQANAIAERMHQTIGDLLRSLIHTNPPNNVQDAQNLLDQIIGTCSHALRTTVHRTMGLSPGAATFNRDMLLDIPYVADFVRLRERRQVKIDDNLRRENNTRRNYDYQIGGQVYEITRKLNAITNKLQSLYRGPYLITQVHTNGTLTIQRTPTLTDRVNIRRLRPVIT